MNPETVQPADLSERQTVLLALLAQRGGQAWQSDLLQAAGVSRAVADALERRGLLEREMRREQRDQGSDRTGSVGDGPLEPPRQLTADQAAALAAIERAAPGSELLLWGVTGAGKTEVYLQAAAACLQQRRSALLLTPEIGLIPQLLDRCRARFGGQVAEYHSGCSDSQRIATWRRALDASEPEAAPLLVVGTRSAVFLPLPRLGLVVLDEEHDRSYKQESPMPCYHARDVARLRAQQSGARLVLGSADLQSSTERSSTLHVAT